jgi:hypothetical protein
LLNKITDIADKNESLKSYSAELELQLQEKDMKMGDL